MKPFILALLILAAPAFAGNKGNIEKTPACVAGAMVQSEPEVRFVAVFQNIFFAQAQVKKLLKEAKLNEPCDMKGRVRSKLDGRCYLKSRLP